MKAFDKWWWKLYTTDKYMNHEDAVTATLAWKAALEWLLTQHLCGYSSDIVKKELES